MTYIYDLTTNGAIFSKTNESISNQDSTRYPVMQLNITWDSGISDDEKILIISKITNALNA